VGIFGDTFENGLEAEDDSVWVSEIIRMRTSVETSPITDLSRSTRQASNKGIKHFN
jgi:hypothetical protein